MAADRGHRARWVVALVAALAVVALLAWADREAGVDDRDTDPEDVTSSQPVQDAEADVSG